MFSHPCLQWILNFRHVPLQLVSFQLESKFSSLSPLIPLSILFVMLCTSCKHMNTFLKGVKDCGDDNFSCTDLHEFMKKCCCKQSLSQEIILDRLFFDFAFHISHIINLFFYSTKIYRVPANHKILSKMLRLKRLIRLTNNDFCPKRPHV